MIIKTSSHPSYQYQMDTSSTKSSTLSQFEALSLYNATDILIRSNKHEVQQSLPFRRSLCQKLERAANILQEDGEEDVATALMQQKFALGQMILDAPRCRLLELPAEIREQIWIHAVTEWASPRRDAQMRMSVMRRQPIRMDRFNRPDPSAITRTCIQVRSETLHLYYEHNIFECWRPLFWLKDWSQSTFIDWLICLGLAKSSWLNNVQLLYKREGELEHDIESALQDAGFHLRSGVVSNRQELSEYEMCYEEMGLPRHFGKNRRYDRWLAATN